MSHPSEFTIRKVAVVGTGVIGSSWTTLFLAKGYQVVVSDPAPGAEEKLSQYIESEWPRIEQIGLAEGASPRNYEFVEDITQHLGDVDFVQENGPERPDFKTKLIANIDAHLPKHAVIASSSSGIPSSQFISECKVDPSRVLIGHPFNPPHLIPLVEIVPHPGTSGAAVRQAEAFYKALGKAPVLLKKEAPGFVANRLQAALLAEAYSLVSRGVASPEDVDTAVTTGPGLRWALAGPYMTNVLGGGGGKDGFDHFVQHLGPAVRGWKEDMDANKFSFEEDETKRLQEQVTPWVETKEPEKVRQEMGDALIELLQTKSSRSSLA
ncbi:hypothetical protein PRZ48_007653 [Zasmidium cellare]|uniref:3-hydroxyacyl-CoA dehydrogenase n=1 Tax=Zasmidium cellare TaxID=395010 RepID=A0ABR0EJW0_ZASCE|nr:hypothetical protein PRZ48_007653 [Zasmidium cellare]